jgi:hypothetical protein
VPFFTVGLEGIQHSGEAFRMGFNVDTGLGGESSSSEVADHIRTAFAPLWAKAYAGLTMREMFSTLTSWSRVVVAERPKDPNAPSTEIAEALFTSLAGSGSGSAFPPETALVVSLMTARPGRSYRGRMYLPAPLAGNAGATDAKGEVSTAYRALVTAWAAEFFGDVNEAVFGPQVVVWSRINQSTEPVTRVAVGNQFDVQSRRQNSKPEAYIYANISGI